MVSRVGYYIVVELKNRGNCAMERCTITPDFYMRKI